MKRTPATKEITVAPTPTVVYETELARLVAVVERLETGELPLAEALTLYEEGVGLGQHCQQLLDTAELRMQRLNTQGDPEPWALPE